LHLGNSDTARTSKAKQAKAGGGRGVRSKTAVRRHGKLTPWRHEELIPGDRRKAGVATDMEGARLSTGVGCVGRGDAGAGGGDGDGAFAPIGLGDEADIWRAGVQPQYGEAVPCGGRLDGDSAAAPPGGQFRMSFDNRSAGDPDISLPVASCMRIHDIVSSRSDFETSST